MTRPTYADFHVHSHLSPCGNPQATAEAMIKRAQERGLVAIGFADHVTPDAVPGCPFYDHQRPHLLPQLRAEIARITDGSRIEVLVGVEADYTLAGQRCLDATILSQADYVVCGASHFHLAGAPRPAGDGPRIKAELMLRIAREALAVPGVSIWAHPFDCSRMRPLVPILETVGDDELAELIALANAHQVAIEVNGGPVRYEDYRQATVRFFGLARKMGARFTVTADAHHPDDFERLDLALAWACSMGFQEKDFLTAQEVQRRHRTTIFEA